MGNAIQKGALVLSRWNRDPRGWKPHRWALLGPLVLSLFILIHPCSIGLAVAQEATPTPRPGSVFDKATDAVEAAEKEVRSFKDAWDKSRLEVTLYEKRAKRAYEKWTKAGKDLRQKAQEAKEKAQLELDLSIEKRKLAYNEWQAALHRKQAREAEAKEQEQRTYIRTIQKRIRDLEAQLTPTKKGG